MEPEKDENQVSLPEHHIQQELCTTRPLYRQGKKLTAVKVYTINNESQHLLFYGVPEIKLSNELKSLCSKYGEVKNFEIVKDHNVDEFTECYHVHFKRIQSSRIAKKFLDNKSFYGGVLHVCYAPEYETLGEVREKLNQRQKDVSSRITPGPTQLEYASFESTASTSQQDRKRKHPARPITEKRLKYEDSNKIWDGIPTELDPRLQDPLYAHSSVGIKKHFQLSKPFGPMYGPSGIEKEVQIIPTNSSNISSDLNDDKIHTTLIPTNVIKSNKKEYNKKIVFRKNKSKEII